MGRATGARRSPDGWDGAQSWLDRVGTLRDHVRQVLVQRQLQGLLDDRGVASGHALDVGAGQGTQAMWLADVGWQVDAVEPDRDMRSALVASLESAPPGVAGRVRVVAGEVANLHDVAVATYDLVMCHGVLMYLSTSDAITAAASLAARVGPGGVLSLLVRNAAALPWRPALHGDWDGVMSALDELDNAAATGTDPAYVNNLGVTARADDVATLMARLTDLELVDQRWRGVRVASDALAGDVVVPDDPDEVAALLDAELALGAHDPYRQLAPLVHVMARRSGERGRHG